MLLIFELKKFQQSHLNRRIITKYEPAVRISCKKKSRNYLAHVFSHCLLEIIMWTSPFQTPPMNNQKVQSLSSETHAGLVVLATPEVSVALLAIDTMRNCRNNHRFPGDPMLSIQTNKNRQMSMQAQ